MPVLREGLRMLWLLEGLPLGELSVVSSRFGLRGAWDRWDDSAIKMSLVRELPRYVEGCEQRFPLLLHSGAHGLLMK